MDTSKNPFEIFNYKNLGSVRVSTDNMGRAWFCLNDVLGILGLTNITEVSRRLDPKGFSSIEVLTNGGPQQMLFVDQGNLYMAIGRSRKPEAQNFMTWVYREVLPSIANTGSYTMFDLNNMTQEQISKLTPFQMVGALAFAVDNINNKLEGLSNTVNNHSSQISGINEHIDMIEKTAYASIADIARFKGIPITLETAQKLGSIATKICSERGIDISSKPHDIYNYIHTYPIFILEEVFSTHLGC